MSDPDKTPAQTPSAKFRAVATREEADALEKLRGEATLPVETLLRRMGAQEAEIAIVLMELRTTVRHAFLLGRHGQPRP